MCSADLMGDCAFPSCTAAVCLCVLQRAAHLQQQSARLPDRPQHQEELGSHQQTRRDRVLLLRQHAHRLPHHQPGRGKGQRSPLSPHEELIKSWKQEQISVDKECSWFLSELFFWASWQRFVLVLILVNLFVSPSSYSCCVSALVWGQWSCVSCRPSSTAPSPPTWPSPKPHTSSVSGRTVGPTPCTAWASPPRPIWAKWVRLETQLPSDHILVSWRVPVLLSVCSLLTSLRSSKKRRG